MSKLEVFSPNGLQLVRIPRFPVLEGQDKFVYKMTDGLNTVAAKVFKTNGQIQHKTGDISQTSHIQRIEEELEGYMQLRETSLEAYIPRFHYSLFNVKKERVGLGFRWEDGVAITELHCVRLEEEEVDLFESAVLTTIAFGVRPYTDSLGIGNIFFNQHRNPRLWLAEYNLERKQNDPLRELLYIGDLDNNMAELRSHIIAPTTNK